MQSAELAEPWTGSAKSLTSVAAPFLQTHRMVSRVSSTWSLTRTVDLPSSAVRQPADGLAGHCAHVQSGPQTPVAQAPAAVPSHSSPNSTTSLPQTGTGQVQSGRQRPAQNGAADPSQSSPTSRTPPPQTGAGASAHVGLAKRKRAMRVLHRPLAGTYSLVYQKVQSSTGSTFIEL